MKSTHCFTINFDKYIIRLTNEIRGVDFRFLCAVEFVRSHNLEEINETVCTRVLYNT